MKKLWLVLMLLGASQVFAASFERALMQNDQKSIMVDPIRNAAVNQLDRAKRNLNLSQAQLNRLAENILALEAIQVESDLGDFIDSLSPAEQAHLDAYLG